MTVQKCCLTLGWDTIGWDNFSPEVQILGIDLSPVGEIFDFSSETAEWNSTKLGRKQDLNALYQVCVFRADRKNKMAALASDWLRHFRLLLWNRWTEFNETWHEASSQCLLPRSCFSGRSGTFSTSPMKPLNGIQGNLTESNVSMSSTKFVFFGLIHKTIWPPLPLIGWDIFWLFLWNHWTEFKETWQKASSQCPLPSLCFSGWSIKQYGRPGLWLAETYFDFFSETTERNSRKLDRKQVLNVFYQVYVFRADP